MKFLLLLLILSSTLQLEAQLKPFYSAEIEKYGFKDSAGHVVVSPRYDLAYAFVEGLAAVRLQGKYGFLDEAGKEIVAPKYDFTWHFIGGYAAVKLDGKYGFIDKAGKEIVPPVYEDANNFHGACCYKGMAHVKEHGKWKIIRL